MVAGIHDNAYDMLTRDGLVETIGMGNFFWSSDQAIVEAERVATGVCEATEFTEI